MEKQGYSYSCFKANGLDYNFNNPVTKNLVLEAFYIPSDSTSYKVEFYYENIEDDGYTLDGEDTSYGTTDSLTPITGYSIPYGFELTNPINKKLLTLMVLLLLNIIIREKHILFLSLHIMIQLLYQLKQ